MSDFLIGNVTRTATLGKAAEIQAGNFAGRNLYRVALATSGRPVRYVYRVSFDAAKRVAFRHVRRDSRTATAEPRQ